MTSGAERAWPEDGPPGSDRPGAPGPVTCPLAGVFCRFVQVRNLTATGARTSRVMLVADGSHLAGPLIVEPDIPAVDPLGKASA